ncbi:hypothetical protein ACT8ZV_10080 [Nocardioides sp. MAHUQ-72]|uniref:hypothetical protein n=1 Tax=unclassified Nocardioides TaxID=2615069 RepID=UPI00361BB4BE
MRISWRDGLATLAVAVATVGYLLWVTDTALTSWSARTVAIGVLVLGVVGGALGAERLVADLGLEGHDRGPMAYVVWMGLLVALAIVSAVVAIAMSSTAWVGLLTLSVVALWATVCARALMLGAGRPHHVGH